MGWQIFDTSRCLGAALAGVDVCRGVSKETDFLLEDVDFVDDIVIGVRMKDWADEN